jgi:hypothetical protein
MLRLSICIMLLVSLMAISAFAQQPDTTAAAAKTDTAAVAPPPQKTPPPPPPETSQPGPKKVYWGGSVGMSFGDYTSISITPLIGYKVTPRFHLGGTVSYEYVSDSRYSETFTSSNYGGSVFSRFLLTPKIYAHAEFADISYEYKVNEQASDRFWVPFLYLGGGIIQPMGPKASLFVEVLFDVLQDDKSPYKDWTPFVSFGVGVGF